MAPLNRVMWHVRPRICQIIQRRSFTEAAARTENKTQVYISQSRNPYLNLSIEHHLLQKTPPESVILFLYTNNPSVVLGRNQNPWVEVNLPLLQELDSSAAGLKGLSGAVDLVRRRSGGGTVFHDQGNVNYSVICPPAAFDRDKHAEMVVRALKRLGADAVRVNCRHDIVMDVNATVPDNKETYKISGSAYKLTRLRSLHHGTCLLSSPNLGQISQLLRSPAEPFIKARGVESVRSKVQNVGIENEAFEDAVVEEFKRMYGDFDVKSVVGEEAASIANVKKGYEELQSREWIYGQTPQFTFSTHPSEDDLRTRPALPAPFKLQFEARHGLIQKFAVEDVPCIQGQVTLTSLLDSRLYDIGDWTQRLKTNGLEEADASLIGQWLNDLLGSR